MRKSKFNEAQISQALSEVDKGTPIEEICSRLSISVATFYNWRKRYHGLDQAGLKEVKSLEDENRSLKQQLDDLLKDREILQYLVSSL
ncbi:MAG: transposase [Candidatus Obscuribacterales bacterium]|nr:transposase [Candidatus Obscuribacterales bacterium]